MDTFLIIFIIIMIIIVIALIPLTLWQNGAGKRLIDKAPLIKFGMTKEEVFEILEYREPSEVTRNVPKQTERYRWTAGKNYYNRSYSRGFSSGYTQHYRHHLTVVFKNGKVIEVSTK